MFRKCRVSLFFLIILKGAFICQAQNQVVHRYFSGLEDSIAGKEWINMDTRATGAGSSGYYFSRTDRLHPYGLGLELPVPEDLQRRNIRISVRGMFRITEMAGNNTVVVSVAEGDSTVFWEGSNVVEKFGQLNQWASFYHSVLIPRNITNGTFIKIYMWNQDGKSETWIDDLEVYLSSADLPSFLPD